MFVMEQSNHKKGGPPRHLHYNEEEHFYPIDGNYVIEVGTEAASRLATSLFYPATSAPRKSTPSTCSFRGSS